MSYPSAPSAAPGTNVLSLIAISEPPPGDVTDFSNPAHNSRPTMVLGGVLLGLATIFVTNRAYFKYFVLRRRSWDDLTLFLGYLGAVFFYGACIWGVKDGVWGRHIWDVSILQAASTDFLVPAFLFVVLYPPTLTLIRISFFIMYLDIFGLVRNLRIAAWAGGIFTILFGTVMTILSFVCATPFPHETWLAQKFTGRAELIVKFSFPQSGFGLAIDIYVLILPIIGVSRLQMRFRRKLGIILVFMSAIFAVLGSLLTMVYRSRLDNESDYTWNLIPVLTVTLLEVFVGIIVACMPAANHTMRMTIPHLESLRSRILRSRYWYHVGSLTYSRRSSRDKTSGDSDTGTSEKLRVKHVEVSEKFVGITVKIPSATLITCCMKSVDRLDAMDLESGRGVYRPEDWRYAKYYR